MKILQITHNYPSEIDKTEGIFLHRINQQLSSNNEVVIILLKPKFGLSRVVDSYKIDNVQVYKVDYFRPKGRIFNSLDGIFMLSARNKLPVEIDEMEIIHSHWQTDGGVLGTYLAKKFNKPHIISVRGARIFHKTRKTIYGQISKHVFKKANLIHTHGEGIFEELHIKYDIPKDKLIWIPNIIFNKSQLQILLDTNLKKSTHKENYRFLFIGLNGKYKGLLDAITAFLSFDAEEGHTLTIVTDTTSHFFRNKINPIVRDKINIMVLNKTSPENVFKYFSETDVFLFPSYAEGSPNVVIEAMAAGCYIISYDIPGLKKLIVHNVNGRLVPINDINSLTGEVNLFVAHKMTSELQRYKAYNYKFIREKFDLVTITNNYNDMYARIIHKEQNDIPLE